MKAVQKINELRARFLSLPRKRKILYSSLIIVPALFFLGTYFYLSVSNFVNTRDTTAENSIEDLPPAKELPESTFSVLLLGHGGRGHPGGSLMDSINLVYVSPEDKKATLISLPRDLWVNIPVDGDKMTNVKINDVYAVGLDNQNFPNKKEEFRGEIGGFSLMKNAVSRVTGYEVDYFISVDFPGFKSLVNSLGGIEVNAPQPYDDYFYPIKGKELDLCGKSPDEMKEVHEKYSGFQLEKQFECRYEHIHFDKGINEMDGDTALKYARSRHGDSDFGRIERQASVLIAIKNKVVSLQILENFGEVFEAIVNVVRTDLDKSAVKGLYELAGNPDDYDITTVHMTEENALQASQSSNGAFILIPKGGVNNWEYTKRFISKSISE